MSFYSLLASIVFIEKVVLIPIVATLKEKYLTFSAYFSVFFPLTSVFKSLTMIHCVSFVGFRFFVLGFAELLKSVG